MEKNFHLLRFCREIKFNGFNSINVLNSQCHPETACKNKKIETFFFFKWFSTIDSAWACKNMSLLFRYKKKRRKKIVTQAQKFCCCKGVAHVGTPFFFHSKSFFFSIFTVFMYTNTLISPMFWSKENRTAHFLTAPHFKCGAPQFQKLAVRYQGAVRS